ncbi:MAG: hypothetical protein QOI27_1696 [Gaiellaceae bacterium]|nr:hypothetical protein [Gaiellaceae bacterium]
MSGQHRGRIATMVVLLTVIAATAGGGLVFSLKAAPASSPRTDTSEFAGEWRPDATTASGRLKQIASFVQRRYVRPGTSNEQLADVSVRQLRAGDAPAKTFEIVHVSSTVPTEQIAASRTAVFSDCGTNPDCSIPGSDTSLIGELAQRQALELALRAFRFDDTLDLVVVEMPGADSQLGRINVFFRRADLARALERPLRSTLPLNPVPRSEYTNPTEKKSLATLVVNVAFNARTTAADRQHAFVLLPAAELQAAQTTSG